MRTAVLILGILGASASGVLAARWLSQYAEQRAEAEPFAPLLERDARLGARLEHLEERGRAGAALVASAVLGFVGLLGVAGGRPRWAGIVLLVGGAVPAFFDTHALIFTGLLLVAGLLALAIPGRRRPPPSFRHKDRLGSPP